MIQKISKTQLEQLRKQIVAETVDKLHKLCPQTLSGRHEWKRVVRIGWRTPKVYYKHKRCANCKVWQDKL